MPNTIQAFPQNNTVTSNPTAAMGINPSAYVGHLPVPTPAQITAAITNFLTMLLQVTGINLPGLVSIVGALGGGLGGVESELQNIVDALTGGLTGTPTTGNNPTAIALALVNAVLSVPNNLLQALLGQLSTAAAQIAALQNTPGVSLADNFATIGVAGYTNLVGPSTAYPTLGTLAVVGGVIRTVNEAVAYRNVGVSTDQHGAHIVVGANMQGIFRLGICCDTAAANWCGLEVYSGFNGDSLRIVTGASPILTVVQAEVDVLTGRFANQNTFDIWYQVATNTFHVLRNGQPVGLDWTDLTNIVTHNSTKRKILLTSNGENNSTAGLYGPNVSQVVAYDHG